MPSPKVSVILLTYNHEEFIGQALDSILSQEVAFTYEVIVGEDCSTDGTRAVVQDYERRYPDRIRPIYQPHNVGPGANAKACWAACTGQYLALLEGDDYWTSPLKLTRQVACLDAEPALSFCFHYVEIIKGQHVEPILFPAYTTQTHFSFPDFARACHAHTGSLLLRNGCRTLPDWLFTTYPIDLALLILYAEVGPARLLPEVMSRYRIHESGTWSGAPLRRNMERLLDVSLVLSAHYARTRHARPIQHRLCRCYLHVSEKYLSQHELAEEANKFLYKAARMPQAYSLPLIRNLAGVTRHWLRYRLRLLSPPINNSPA